MEDLEKYMESTGHNIDVQNIPAEMREHRAWCNWHTNPTAKSKIPLCSHRLNKLSDNWQQPYTFLHQNDPADYATFAEAMEQTDINTGIGYVANRANRTVLIDFDNVLDDTGTAPYWVNQIITAIDSYTEKSVSGRGIHIWCYSDPYSMVKDNYPGLFDGEHRLEVYFHNHYGIVNGHSYHEEHPLPMRDATAELHEIISRFEAANPRNNRKRTQEKKGYSLSRSDSEVIERMFGSGKGAEIRRLWNGDISGYPSHSEADAALSVHLIYWTNGDQLGPAQADRLFRASALMRDKWDEKDHDSCGRTYGEITMANAIEYRRRMGK